MNRQEELNEAVTLINAICKKYEVRFDVSLTDMKPKEEDPPKTAKQEAKEKAKVSDK